MLFKATDASGLTQNLIVKGQEAITDHSSTIAATGVSQLALAANALRSGFFIQNVGTHNMLVNDLGVATTAQGSFLLVPGAIFPPDNYPITTNAINIIGTLADGYTLREW